jgi:hypothetical protein
MENKISEDYFWEHYNPQTNHLDNNAGFDGCMFETYGNELEFVLAIANSDEAKRVWTILEADGKLFYSAGYHIVNRLGYIITARPYEHETDYVELDNDFK